MPLQQLNFISFFFPGQLKPELATTDAQFEEENTESERNIGENETCQDEGNEDAEGQSILFSDLEKINTFIDKNTPVGCSVKVSA